MTVKRIIVVLLVALMGVTGAWAQNNVIRYTATEDLGYVLWSMGASNSATSSVYNPNTLEGVVTYFRDITTIPNGKFSNITSLISIHLPTSITSIESGAFSECTSLTSINLSGRLTSIGNTAFYKCSSLTSISIPDKVTYFGYNPFYGCNSLKTVIINSQQTLDAMVEFQQTFGNQVKECILRGNITSIPENNFSLCSITKITLPKGMTSIATGAFDMSSLQSVVIPESVTSIGYLAFRCPLQSIIVLATTPPSIDSSFLSVDTSIPVYVPEGTLNDYRTANGWNTFTNFVEVSPCVLDLISSSPSLGKVYGAGMYEYGTEQAIYAVPEAGSKFTGWSDGNTENPRQYVVMSDATLTANFEVAFPEPTGTGVRMKVTKKDNKVYEFKTQDVKNVSFYQANE